MTYSNTPPTEPGFYMVKTAPPVECAEPFIVELVNPDSGNQELLQFLWGDRIEEPK